MKRWGRFHVGTWSGEWSLPSIPRPTIRWYWADNTTGCVAFAFGDQHSDPILWLCSPDYTPPRWLEPILDRIGRA